MISTVVSLSLSQRERERDGVIWQKWNVFENISHGTLLITLQQLQINGMLFNNLILPTIIFRIFRIWDVLPKDFYIKTNSYLTCKKVVVRFCQSPVLTKLVLVDVFLYISITLFAKLRNLCNLVINRFAHLEIAQLFFYCKKIPCIMYQIISKVWTFILASTVPKSNNVVVIDNLCKITANDIKQS